MVAQVGVARALGQGQAGTRQGSHVSLWLLSTPPICPSRCHVHLFRLSKIRQHLGLSRRNRRQLSLHLTRERKTLLLSNNTLPNGHRLQSLDSCLSSPNLSSSFMPLSTLIGVLGSQTHLSSDNKTQQPQHDTREFTLRSDLDHNSSPRTRQQEDGPRPLPWLQPYHAASLCWMLLHQPRSRASLALR